VPPASPTQHAINNMPTETVILLDYDDTLLCSSFLAAHGMRLDSPLPDLSLPLSPAASPAERQAREVATQLRELETCVHQLLINSINHSHRTIVVTNAEQGWVQLSAARFLPSILPLLERVTIISARTAFETLFPASPLKWKYFAMHSSLVGGGYFGHDGRAGVDKHVISLGDSHVEREAVRALCKNVPSTRTKTVKFSEQPSCEQLRRQIELVNQCFGYITSHPGDLDLQLTVTAAPEQPQPPATPASVPAPSVAADTKSTGAATSPLHVDSSAAPLVHDALTATEAKDVSPSASSASAAKRLQQEGGSASSMAVVA